MLLIIMAGNFLSYIMDGYIYICYLEMDEKGKIGSKCN